MKLWLPGGIGDAESFMREFAECLFRYVNIHTPLLQTLLILYQGEQNG